MKRLKNKKIILGWGVLLLILVSYSLPFAIQVFAAEGDYQVLAPLPGVAEKAGDTTTLSKYVPAIFKIAIGLAVVFAVLVIVYGGFLYMSTDAFQGKEDGKNMVWNAVKGLVLVIGAWLILNTINPNLLTFDLTISPAEVSAPAGGAVTAGIPMTDAQITESSSVRTSLESEGVFTYKGPCTAGQTTGCVNLNALPDVAKDGLVVLKNTLKSDIIITGGTEGGHATHGPNKPMVDLRPTSNLNSKLGYPSPKEGDTITKTFKTDGSPDITATFTYEEIGGNAAGTSSGDHWHVEFK